MNNTGNGTAYYANTTINCTSGIVCTSVLYYGNITRETNTTNTTDVIIPAGAAAGGYTITLLSKWSNPDGTLGQKTKYISVTVTQNPILDISEGTEELTVQQGQANSTNITLNATGNTAIQSINLTCETTECTDLGITFTPSNISSLSAGSSQIINVSSTVPLGYTPNTYLLTINATGSLDSDTATLNLIIPPNKTWARTPSSFASKYVGEGSTGNVGTIIITNHGNENLAFTAAAVGNISSYVELNSSSFTINKQTSGVINVDYNASAGGYYEGNISLRSTGASPEEMNVSFAMDVTAFEVSIISPTQASPLNVTGGGNATIYAAAAYGGATLTSGITWSANIGSSSCSALNSSYSSIWILVCTAPSIQDGTYYNLELIGNYTSTGTITTDTESNAIYYPDVTAPAFVNVSAHPITQGQAENITINATDLGTGISRVWLEISFANGTNATYYLNQYNGLYNLTFADTSAWEIGDYDIIVYANDTTNNTGNTTAWFDVYFPVIFSGYAINYAGEAVNSSFILYRPNTSSIIHNITANRTTGFYNQSIHGRFYDISFLPLDYEFRYYSVNISESVYNPFLMDNPRPGAVPMAFPVGYNIIAVKRPPLIVFALNTSIDYPISTINMSYINTEKTDYENEFAIRMLECLSWDYDQRLCGNLTGWIDMNATLDVNSFRMSKYNKTKVENAASLIGYSLAEVAICGENGCETPYESCQNCPTDCGICPAGAAAAGGGGGGGGGGGASLEDITSEIAKAIPPPVSLKKNAIEAVLYRGEFKLDSITLTNNLKSNVIARLSVNGTAFPLVTLEKTEINIPSKEEISTQIKLEAPDDIRYGTYTGMLSIDFNSSAIPSLSLPITIKVIEKMEPLLDVKVEAITKEVYPGEHLKFGTTIYNMGQTDRVDVVMNYSVKVARTEEVIETMSETLAVDTSKSFYRSINISKDTNPGQYIIEATGTYAYNNKTATSLDTFQVVSEPFLVRIIKEALSFRMYGIHIWQLFVIIIIIIILIRAYLKMKEKWIEEAKKRLRYTFPVDLRKLPRKSARSLWIGKIAEAGKDAYLDMDDLTVHLLAAGGTGSGKSVAAMGVVEELLDKGIPVLVFDPTMQWTGFMKPCTEDHMTKFYEEFGMKKERAKAYKTNLIYVEDPDKFEIDVKKCMEKKGELTIFGISKLRSGHMDKAVQKVIDSVFDASLPESSQLKAMLVFDEVHRLLPKYGGTRGYISLERGMREFRKWGLGMIMISQVLSDFRGAVRANVGTELQLRTKYSGDLNRVKEKYGGNYVKAVVKEGVGTALVQNSKYNDGLPYFIRFRPLLHSPHRIPEEELKVFKEFMNVIISLKKSAEELKAKGVDTSSIDLELTLAENKIKEGKTRMTQLYIDSVKKTIEKMQGKS